MQTQTQIMEVSLSNELLEGEEVLWSGRPVEGGRSIVSPARVFLIIGLVYGGVGLLLILLSLIFVLTIGSFLVSGGFLGLFLPGSIFLLLGILFLLLSHFGRFAPKSTFYAITNRRVIILRGGSYLRVLSYDTRAITQVQRFERPDGSGDLIFSGVLSGYPGVYGGSTSSNNGYSTRRQNVFSAIANVRLVERKLLGVMGKE